jgi:SAM-dependent methyltransferase
MAVAKDLHEDNRQAWNAATVAHNSHKGDQAAFLRAGGSTLFPEEIDLLGDLTGQRLLHLQCNSGQDTLSLAALGARVTGVDISDEAIEFARKLSAESGIPGEFVRSDVFDWFDAAPAAGERFDTVFCSYGATGWLSELTGWARGIAGVLRPGGRFVTVEFHPVYGMLDEDWQLTWDYSSGGKPISFESGVGDYVALAREGLVPWGYQDGVTDFRNPHGDHEFGWGLADVIGALLAAGLRLESVAEYPYSNGAQTNRAMRELPGRRFVPPAELPAIPLMYSLCAVR